MLTETSVHQQVSTSFKMPIILYVSPDSPPCMSVMILAKMTGVELQSKTIDYEDLRKEPFLKINPAHSIPALDDNGFHIWESRVIMGYLVQQYAENDQLYPKDTKKRAKVDNMLHFDVGNLYASITECLTPATMYGVPVIAEVKDKMKDRLSILNTILSKQPYVAGDSLSLADISIRCSLAGLVACGYSNYSEHPNVAKWIERFDKEVPVSNDILQDGTKRITDWVNDSLKKFGLNQNLFQQK